MNYLILKKIRLEKKISLTELSKRTGLSRQYLYNIENGKNNPTIDKLIMIGHYLGVNMLDLIGDPTNEVGGEDENVF